VTCLLDTDLLVAWLLKREGKHHEAEAIVAKALVGAWGSPFVTDFVLDEALTLLMVRGAPSEAIDRLLAATFEGPTHGQAPPIPVSRVSDGAFREAVPLFRRHYRRGLSFTDCTSLAVMAERHVAVIASFDRGFDGLVARLPS
jgi:predicted nucleic acid-binding protein